MTDPMIVKSKFADVVFPLNEAVEFNMSIAPSRGEFMAAVAAYHDGSSGVDKVAVMIAGNIRCLLMIDGFRYTDAARKKVAFMGDFAYCSDPDVGWLPCFGECDFTTTTGKVIVHDKRIDKN